MGDIRKKTEIKINLGKDLLDLAKGDEESLSVESVKGNTSLTIPEFEDKDAQESWDNFASKPLKTSVNPFLRESVSEENVKSIEIEQKNLDLMKSNDISVGQIKPENIPNIPPPKPNIILKDKMPISSVETVAITMLQRAIVETDKPQIAQLAPKVVKNSEGNHPYQNNKLKNQLGVPFIKSEPPISAPSNPAEHQVRVSENKLGHIEQIRIAQNRVSQLEKEVETLKWDNEKLGAAAKLLQKNCDELSDQKQKLEIRFENFESKTADENKVLRSNIDKKREENRELRSKLEELESRLVQDIRRSGGRERELENRLELIKMERISLVANKDDIILNLKRQIDHLQFEVEGYRKKTTELQKIIDTNDEQTRRTVRALRLALTNLELSEESKVSKKGD
jgi:predicted  nucleic acid-binding Zn-ribbon protein